MITFSRHLKSFSLPFVVAFAIPTVLLLVFGMDAWHLDALLVAGLCVLAVGSALLVRCVMYFHEIGKGTLAPWDPPTELVVEGPYRYVRNPMISGVVFMLVGEALVFHSIPLGVWAALFFTVKTIYFLVDEEPGLDKRFGESYQRYKAHVPRWIPRLTPWDADPTR